MAAFVNNIMLLVLVIVHAVRVTDSQSYDPVVSLVLNYMGFGAKEPHLGTCPNITRNEKSRLFYVENGGNIFTPGKPRHLRSAPKFSAKLNSSDRYLVSDSSTNDKVIQRHLFFKRSTNVRPVNVDSYLDAYVYDPPTDGAGHRCGNFCTDDESCGLRRKCCRTPCGYACYEAVIKTDKKQPIIN